MLSVSSSDPVHEETVKIHPASEVGLWMDRTYGDPSLESKVDKSMLAKIKPLHLERIGAQPSRKEGIKTFVTSPRQKWRPEL